MWPKRRNVCCGARRQTVMQVSSTSPCPGCRPLLGELSNHHQSHLGAICESLRNTTAKGPKIKKGEGDSSLSPQWQTSLTLTSRFRQRRSLNSQAQMGQAPLPSQLPAGTTGFRAAPARSLPRHLLSPTHPLRPLCSQPRRVVNRVPLSGTYPRLQDFRCVPTDGTMTPVALVQARNRRSYFSIFRNCLY